MNEARIVEMWNNAVAEVGDCACPKIIARFAELVAADEREACAQVCEEQAISVCFGHDGPAPVKAYMCASAIRNRSNA